MSQRDGLIQIKGVYSVELPIQMPESLEINTPADDDGTAQLKHFESIFRDSATLNMFVGAGDVPSPPRMGHSFNK